MRLRPLRTGYIASWLALGLLLAGGPVRAQSMSETTRVVSVNFGTQFISDAFMNTVPLRLYDEDGSFDAHYDVAWQHALDGGIAMRFRDRFDRFAVGVAGSHVAEPVTARIDAAVPHPFFFDFPRTESGTLRGLTRREIGVHVQGQYWWTPIDRLLLRGGLGPTLFIARQELVSTVGVHERGIDYDQIVLGDYGTRTVTTGSVGFNVGVDGSWFLTERLGVGLRVRYTRGTATVGLGNEASTPLELGGTFIAGGLRLTL